jgi:hypothetical protein
MTDDTIPVFAPPRQHPATAPAPTFHASLWTSSNDGRTFWFCGVPDWVVAQSPTGNWIVYEGSEAIEAYPTVALALARAEKLAGGAS